MSFWSAISVVMIACDAADVIDAALASVPEPAERLVAEGGSNDDTAARARVHGARLVAQDTAAIRAASGNYDVARNALMAAASRPWLFVLDADERIPEALAAQIAALREPLPVAAFDMPRRNLFWGRPVRLLGEDRQVRLVRAGRGRYVGHQLHRGMRVEGAVGHLAAPLLHENVRSLSDLVRRWRRDVPIEAAAPRVAGERAAAPVAPRHLFRHYYVGNGAWRDGWLGFWVSALYAARSAAVSLRSARTTPRPGPRD
jgi:glycosyltransferase involved in cell wall biosynthesis